MLRIAGKSILRGYVERDGYLENEIEMIDWIGRMPYVYLFDYRPIEYTAYLCEFLCGVGVHFISLP